MAVLQELLFLLAESFRIAKSLDMLIISTFRNVLRKGGNHDRGLRSEGVLHPGCEQQTFHIQAEGTGVSLTGLTDPVTVVLTIGIDSGTTDVTAQFQ